MNKKALNERDICTKFITPALRRAGWDELAQIREEVNFTKGRIIVRGKLVTRGEGKRADYVLYYKPNIPIAIVEAKDNNHAVGAGLQQALDYGKTYTAFQIIWRLWKAKQKKRILYLADRNVLIDQTMVNDFRPFGAAMAKLSTGSKTTDPKRGTGRDRDDARVDGGAPRGRAGWGRLRLRQRARG
jgi:type I site-specific restriction endonuclease